MIYRDQEPTLILTPDPSHLNPHPIVFLPPVALIPRSSLKEGSAPNRKSTSTRGRDDACTARWSAVTPSLSGMEGEAPDRRRTEVTQTRPLKGTSRVGIKTDRKSRGTNV